MSVEAVPVIGGLLLIVIVLCAVESKDPSVRMVFRSGWGAAIYIVGALIATAGVLS